MYCNIHVKLSGEVSTTSSTVTYDKSTDTLRVEVIPGSAFLRPQPNQHYFLYQTLRWKGWENHPFTLASYSLVEEDSAMSVNNKSGRYKLIFYIRPFNGWTAKLRTACLAAPNLTTTPRLLIEGPYGVRKSLHLYETVILVMGGTGIAGATIHLQDHASRVLAGTTETMNTTLLWATKQAAMIKDVRSKELKHMLGREDFNALYFATREGIDGQPITSDEKKEHALASDDGVGITYGRPDIKQEILKAIDDAKEAGIEGRVAVFVCGPRGMANDARSAVRTATKRGDKKVDLIEETFGW